MLTEARDEYTYHVTELSGKSSYHLFIATFAIACLNPLKKGGSICLVEYHPTVGGVAMIVSQRKAEEVRQAMELESPVLSL